MICNLCKKKISVKKERYVHVEDYDKEKFIKDIWAHLSCFNKAMNRELTDLEKRAKMMLDKAMPILDMLPKQPEVYEVK